MGLPGKVSSLEPRWTQWGEIGPLANWIQLNAPTTLVTGKGRVSTEGTGAPLRGALEQPAVEVTGGTEHGGGAVYRVDCDLDQAAMSPYATPVRQTQEKAQACPELLPLYP